MRPEMDRTFSALAHSGRRTLLDALYKQNGQTLLQLCSNLQMSRQAASKHLAVLERANLVAAVWQGREKRHYLNPVPLQAIYERWIRKFEGRRLEALSALKDVLTQKYLLGRSVHSDWKVGSEVKIVTPEGSIELQSREAAPSKLPTGGRSSCAD